MRSICLLLGLFAVVQTAVSYGMFLPPLHKTRRPLFSGEEHLVSEVLQGCRKNMYTNKASIFFVLMPTLSFPSVLCNMNGGNIVTLKLGHDILNFV
jgi:hypothetical protein